MFSAITTLQKISMTQQTYPRSPKVLLRGIAHLGRFIDKIRLRNAGKIQDYNYITVGFDKHLIDFLGIDPKAFEQRVLTGGTDDELLAAMNKIAAAPALRAELGEKGYCAFLRWWSKEAHMELYFDLLRRTAIEKFGCVPWEGML